MGEVQGLVEIDGVWIGQYGGDCCVDQGVVEYVVGDVFFELGGGCVGGVQMYWVVVVGDCGE